MFRVFVRHCSEGVTKAEVKISWNRDNKQLFGKVRNVKKKVEKIKSDVPEVPKVPKLDKPEPILGSEMHWLLGQNRHRMLAKPYDDTERIALRVKHPKDREETEQKQESLRAILKVPMLPDPDESLQIIPELQNINATPPSVGKILQATMTDAARNALIKWKLSKIEELGEEGFKKLQQENLSRGLRFHNMVQDYFTGVSDNDHLTSSTDSDSLVWKSVQSVLPEINRPALFVEKRLVHPVLHYKGVVDCVSTIGQHTFAIEWKNSEKAKSTISATFDAPLQLCAYLGALNANRRDYNVEITSGMVVVAYQNGRPADSYKLDEVQLQKYWNAWLLRVQEYWIRHRDGTLPEPIF